MYSLELLMMDERPSEICKVSFQNKIILYTGASSWFYYRNDCTAFTFTVVSL